MKSKIGWVVICWACLACFFLGQYVAATQAKIWRDGAQIHLEILGQDFVHIAN